MPSSTRSTRNMARRKPLEDRTNTLRNNHTVSTSKAHTSKDNILRGNGGTTAHATISDNSEPAAGTRNRRIRSIKHASTSEVTQEAESANAEHNSERKEMDKSPDGVLCDSEALCQISATEDDITEDNLFSFTGSVLQATPLAAQLSSRALTSFKRRARQPSMLAMVRQRSISKAAPSAYDFDDIDDDFAPELSGTPVRTQIQHDSSDSSSSRTKLKAGQQTQHRHSGADGGHNAVDHSQYEPSAGLRADPETLAEGAGVHAACGAASPVAAAHQVAASPEDPSVLADPSSQHSSSPDVGRSKRKRMRRIPSTADLQTRLPRRRRVLPREPSVVRSGASHDAHDAHDSGSSTTDDESLERTRAALTQAADNSRDVLGHVSAQQRVSRIGSRHARRPNSVATQLSASHRGRTSQPADSTPPLTAESDHDLDSRQASSTSSSHHLDDIKRKFAEIDQWPLVFETVTPEDSIASQEYR